MDVTDTNEVLKNYEGWLYKKAGQLLGPTNSGLDDLVQEGRIAMWKALGTHKPGNGSLPSWLTNHARWRMIEVATGRKYEGQPPRLHGQYSSVEPRVDSLDEQFMNTFNTHRVRRVPEPADRTATAAIERAEMAAHRGEIAAARRNLTPAQQRYITARFYLQLSHREMVLAGVFSYDPSALFNSAKNGAKHKLAAELAHLKGVEG